MNKLPGLGYLRMLPLTSLVRSQLIRCYCAQAMNNQRSIAQNPGTVTALLTTYRTVRCRLIRNISVATIRRRSKMNSLEKRSIANGQAASDAIMPKKESQKGIRHGQASKTLSKSNFWVSLQSSRTYATMTERLDKSQSSKRSNNSVERPMVPIFSYANYPDIETRSTRTKRTHTNANLLAKENVKSQAKNVDKTFPCVSAKRTHKERKLITPTLPLMRVLKKKEQLAMAQSTRTDSTKALDIPNFRYDDDLLNSSVDTVRHVSAVPCQTILQKFAPPKMSFLKDTTRPPNYLETYESRLRASRQSQPLNLKVPPPTYEQHSTLRNLYTPSKSKHLAQKHGLNSRQRSSILALPNSKYSKMALPYRSARNRKPPYQKGTTRAPKTADDGKAKPGGVHKLSKTLASKHPEQEDLHNLLGDLLPNNSRNPNVQSIHFNKVAPLCKLVTNSMEGRSELHTRTFKKQLEVPQLYKHPTIRSYRKPSGGKRRTISVAQSSANQQKNVMDSKLYLLLSNEEDDDDYDDEHDDD